MENPKELLQESLQKIVKDQNYENCQIIIKNISSDGANFSSHLYLATVHSPGKEDLKLFAKVAGVGDQFRAIAPFFEIESFFYNKLLLKYKELEEKYNVPIEHRLLTAKFYGGSEEPLKETLVLEDLTAKSFMQIDRLKSIDWEYASKALENLAKFHALSIALSVYDPEYFQNLDILKRKIDDATVENFMKSAIDTALQVIRDENRKHLQKFFESQAIGDNDKYNRVLRRAVIIHGDHRPSNLMHRIVDGQMEVISVDYQMISIGNPTIDILYVIYLGSDKKFRDQYFKPCLEHYYEELCKALKRLELDPQKLYSKEDFDFEVKEMLPVGLIQSICCLPIVTVDKDNAPPVREDFSLEQLNVSPSALYAERINDIVEDFIEMGIIKK